MKLSKIDVARIEIETAIELFLEDHDPVSPHVLASAANAMLQGILAGRRRAGGTHPLSITEEVERVIKPERLWEFRELMNAPYNFFKHADRDAYSEIDFNERLTDVTIFAAITAYLVLGEEWTPTMRAFLAWFTASYPHLLSDSFEQKRQLVSRAAQFEGLPRAEVKREFRDLLPRRR